MLDLGHVLNVFLSLLCHFFPFQVSNEIQKVQETHREVAPRNEGICSRQL